MESSWRRERGVAEEARTVAFSMWGLTISGGTDLVKTPRYISTTPCLAVSVVAIDPDFSEALSDRYRIERELGRGGMATVYLAHDLRHDRPVATS